MVQKCRTNQAPPYLCNVFHKTRDLVSFRGAKEYKLLPENTRNIKNISTTSYKDHDQPLDSWSFSECTSNVGEMLGTFDNSDYISEA